MAAIISLAPNYIQFPYSDPQEAKFKRGFHAKARFRNIIGAIDCTHVAIKSTVNKKFSYVNRKGFHSINVKIVAIDGPGSSDSSSLSSTRGLTAK